jgi:hypothetical protein
MQAVVARILFGQRGDSKPPSHICPVLDATIMGVNKANGDEAFPDLSVSGERRKLVG